MKFLLLIIALLFSFFGIVLILFKVSKEHYVQDETILYGHYIGDYYEWHFDLYLEKAGVLKQKVFNKRTGEHFFVQGTWEYNFERGRIYYKGDFWSPLLSFSEKEEELVRTNGLISSQIFFLFGDVAIFHYNGRAYIREGNTNWLFHVISGIAFQM